MGIENHFQNIPEENTPEGVEETMQDEAAQASEKAPHSKIRNAIRKATALAGVIGLGYFGGLESTSADEVEPITGNRTPTIIESNNRAPAISAESAKIMENMDLFESIKEDSDFLWGMQLVKKMNAKNESFYAERFVKIEKKGHKIIKIGEYDNLFDANKALSEMKDIPDEVRKYNSHAITEIEKDKEFNRSGLVKPKDHPEGKTHVEQKYINVDGTKLMNTVEVDEKGDVVKLIETKWLD